MAATSSAHIVLFHMPEVESEAVRQKRSCVKWRHLAANGCKEVVLTGIHLSSYGIRPLEIVFLHLIQEVHKVEGIRRIRLGSLEPGIID